MNSIEIIGILTEEMKRVVTEIQLCYVATVTPDGKPNLSPKGSITVLSDDELGFTDLAAPGTIENLRHNPAIEPNVVDPFTHRGFRFKGAAKVMKDPKLTGGSNGSWGRTIAQAANRIATSQ